MADLKISQLSDALIANTTDVFPFTQLGQTKKITFGNLNNALPLFTFVRNNSASWLGGGGGAAFAAAQFQINGNNGLFNTLNSTEYIVPWNTISFQTSPTVIEADDVLNNMIIKQTGIYLLVARYSSYDMIDASDYLRIRLRGSASSPITTAVGGSLLETIDEGFLRTNENGRATVRGATVLNITSVPYYLAITFLHSGASGTGGTTGYPVFENSAGTLPFMNVIKLI